jgi:putative ABC transport system permease protein
MFQHCLQLSGTGIAIGLAVSMAVTRALSALLYDTSPSDPASFPVALFILVIVAFGAALFPAWRVAHIDAIMALRAE